MAWKLFRFWDIGAESSLPALSVACPAWALDTKRLKIHDGTNWRTIRDTRVIQLDASATVSAIGEDQLLFNINPAAARALNITAGGNIGTVVAVRNLGSTYNITVNWSGGSQVVAPGQLWEMMWDGATWTAMSMHLPPNWNSAFLSDLQANWPAILHGTPAGGSVTVTSSPGAYAAFASDNRIFTNSAGAVAIDITNGATSRGTHVVIDNINVGTTTITFAAGKTIALVSLGMLTVMWDGTYWVMVNKSGAPFRWVYSAASGTFVAPVSGWYDVQVQGGGGGAGGCNHGAAGTAAGGSGGGGGYAQKRYWLTAGVSYTYAAGAVGAGGGSSASGSAGGNSTFSDGTTVITGAGGGGGGVGNPGAYGASGAGGGGTNGDVNIGGLTGVGYSPAVNLSAQGGASVLSPGSMSYTLVGTATMVSAGGANYGAGASGPANNGGGIVALAGANGGAGIVIIEL